MILSPATHEKIKIMSVPYLMANFMITFIKHILKEEVRIRYMMLGTKGCDGAL